MKIMFLFFIDFYWCIIIFIDFYWCIIIFIDFYWCIIQESAPEPAPGKIV